MMIESPEIDPEQVRQTMRRWATGVTVVTSCHNGFRHGMTVSSFTSISLSPPLLLVSLQHEARTHSLVKSSRVFGVTLLREDQAAISDRFAGRLSEESNRFEGLQTFDLLTGSPFLQDGLAFMDCQVAQEISIGDHTLFIGRIVALQTAPAGQPLIYFDRHYHSLKERLTK